MHFSRLKYYCLLFISGCLPFYLTAQSVVISQGQGKVYPSYQNRVDALVMLNGISPETELTLQADGAVSSIEWYEYYNVASSPAFHPLPVFLSNQSSIQPDDNCGYSVKLSGTRNGQAFTQTVTVFVMDYQSKIPSDLQLTPVEPVGCDNFRLAVSGNIPAMYYSTSTGLVYAVERELELDYETLEWSEGWKSKSIREKVQLDEGSVPVAVAPLKDTYFTVTGDQFSADLGVSPFSVKSGLFPAKRVACKITTTATVRTEKHESDRPETVTTLSGSAPLEIRFKSNGNEPVANYYIWTIHREDALVLTRTDESHNFTFTEAGQYVVKVRAENATCTATDSLIVTISESAISAPNVFTPNGDEINDEFRVSYKSIIEFQGVIFNRWGTKMFEWTDVQKGWDGTHNGRPVKEGPYFYVIRARGSEGKIYNLKGDINLLRGKGQ